MVVLACIPDALAQQEQQQQQGRIDEFAVEVATLIKLLQHAHVNRSDVGPAQFERLVDEFMLQLDPERVFLLELDRRVLSAKYAKRVYSDLTQRGDIRAATVIFELYRLRVQARVEWIKKAMESIPDFTADEYYARVPAREWLPNVPTADEHWRRRLKHELLMEILDGADATRARDIVLGRYHDLLRHIGNLDAIDRAEMFLTTVCQLYDVGSGYLSMRQFAEFGQSKASAGMGAKFARVGMELRVREVMAETSADGNLRPGDRIVAVGNEGERPVAAYGMTVRQLETWLPGVAGTKLELTVKRAVGPDATRSQLLRLTRTSPTLQPVRARLMIPPRMSSVAVVTVPSLYGVLDADDGSSASSCSTDVARLLKQAIPANVSGMVLDLRGNGGGYFDEAIELSALFVGRRVITRLRHYDGTLMKNVAGRDAIYHGPLIVLVDRLTASGGEMVAGALQCYGRAIVVGAEATWGNATVQQVLEMKQLSRTLVQRNKPTGAAKVTIQKFYLPDGTSPQLKGLRSDIVIPCAADLVWEGEVGLRRPLAHDRLEPDGLEPTPFDPQLLRGLREASERRQQSLPEFAAVNALVERMRKRANTETSLQVNRRIAERREDDRIWRLGSGDSADQLDVSLREAIRILGDLINLGADVSDRQRK